MKLYDKKQIDFKNLLFDNRALFWLILPIAIEQLLNLLMGLADTMMVSTVGSGNKEDSNKAARQVVLTVSVISLAIMAVGLLGGERLLRRFSQGYSVRL